jgi:mRNA interferase MazF
MKTPIQQFDIWIADLNPKFGTEPGKVRPVVIIQTDLLNKVHPSVIICPISTNVIKDTEILRVHLKKGQASLKKDCDILVDQIRAIDRLRLKEKLGSLPEVAKNILKENLKVVLDL